eukprot:TRINITY_DN420_c0_g1_i1.p1 TRINITY_DN420_c0_g1~~TRINITY_DN420_c0_g1_i1.p1  ORF type:complete len:351 (-),score=84.63 TRINITY_DN420_c0_g1_i1:55-1107(-)
MCRFIMYNGPAVQLSKICIEPEHGMLQQAIRAMCIHTPLNADGFGISWYTPGINVPGLYKDLSPAWNNSNLKHVTRSVKSPLFFAHVRAASTGGVNYPNCHPFVYKNLSFMHNGTASYFKQIKRQMMNFVSERAYQLVQGTTDSEMMFAMFVTNFERLLGIDGKDEFHQKQGDGIEDEFSYVEEGQDQTQNLADALRLTLRQVHSLILDYEYKTGIQEKPSTSSPASSPSSGRVDEAASERALFSATLPETKAIGRLNLAVSDGKSSCVARYVTSAPETAHTLYYATGKSAECTNNKCRVVKDENNNNNNIAECTIVSSEPLSSSFECESVPVNHMVVNGINKYFAIQQC